MNRIIRKAVSLYIEVSDIVIVQKHGLSIEATVSEIPFHQGYADGTK